MKSPNNTDRDPKALADSYMLTVLQRATDGGVTFADGEICLRIMQAYQASTTAREKNEILERLDGVIALSKDFARHYRAEPFTLLEESKNAIKTAVAQAVAETMEEVFAQQNSGGRAALPE